ncbi:Optineurin [Yarrowia sp. E02]|nr:Optineurin [Yarrowia sp. E02]
MNLILQSPTVKKLPGIHFQVTEMTLPFRDKYLDFDETIVPDYSDVSLEVIESSQVFRVEKRTSLRKSVSRNHLKQVETERTIEDLRSQLAKNKSAEFKAHVDVGVWKALLLLDPTNVQVASELSEKNRLLDEHRAVGNRLTLEIQALQRITLEDSRSPRRDSWNVSGHHTPAQQTLTLERAQWQAEKRDLLSSHSLAESQWLVKSSAKIQQLEHAHKAEREKWSHDKQLFARENKQLVKENQLLALEKKQLDFENQQLVHQNKQLVHQNKQLVHQNKKLTKENRSLKETRDKLLHDIKRLKGELNWFGTEVCKPLGLFQGSEEFQTLERVNTRKVAQPAKRRVAVCEMTEALMSLDLNKTPPPPPAKKPKTEDESQSQSLVLIVKE